MIIRDRHSRRRGSALIIALLVVALLTLMVVEFAYEVRVDASLANNTLLELKAEYAARSAVNIVKAMLRNDWMEDYSKGKQKADTPDEEWAQWMQWPQAPPDRVLEPIEIDDATVYIVVSDEDAKINVNRIVKAGEPLPGRPPQDMGLDPAVQKAIGMLYQELLVGVDPQVLRELVYILADWIDVDEMPRSEFSAESLYYQLLDVPYVCKNGPLTSIDEMLMLRGYNRKVVTGVGQFPGLKAYLTVYGGMDGAINVNTAPESALRAVFADNPGIAQTIIERRERQYFEGDASLDSIFGGASVQDPRLAALRNRVKTQSQVFSCDCLVEIGDYQKRLRCVLMRVDGPSKPLFRVLMWKELG